MILLYFGRSKYSLLKNFLIHTYFGGMGNFKLRVDQEYVFEVRKEVTERLRVVPIYLLYHGMCVYLENYDTES